MSSSAPDGEFPLHVLREYSLIADGERGALIGPRGDIAWLCAPLWDSDAVFSSLIGGRGAYAVTPAASAFVWGGYYEPGTLIWRSRWVTTTERMETRDALAFPGDPHRVVVLRRVQAFAAEAVVNVVLDPSAGFGTDDLRDLRRHDGVWTARIGDLHLRWAGAEAATVDSSGVLRAVIRVAPGSTHDLILEISDRAPTDRPVSAGEAWARTEQTWRQAVPTISGTVADVDAGQAVAVLRGLTASSGAMVAAATMALPERAGQGRNYDYRYAWIRDQCYTGRAAAAVGASELVDDAVRFVSDRLLADGAGLKPAYTTRGGRIPDQRTLPLPGYPGGSDLLGNWVNQQFQLDGFGEALELFAAAADLDRLDGDHWRAVEAAVAGIEQRRNEPDAGIWEIDNRHWTHSALTCVSGLRAIAPHAPSAQRSRLQDLANLILADTTASAVHPSGRWKRARDDDRVDAALLLPAIRGAVPANDPRSIATLRSALDELAEDGYMYRFRPDARPLGQAEGAFLLCGFVTSLALHQQGDEVEAIRWFERTRAACGSPGLFTEEYAVRQRQLRGNLPQAFVHALLLETSKRLTEPWH